MSTTLSCILIMRPRGIEPIIDGVLWPEDQTPAATAMVSMRVRANVGMVMSAISFPAGTTREMAEKFLENPPETWRAETYRRGRTA